MDIAVFFSGTRHVTKQANFVHGPGVTAGTVVINLKVPCHALESAYHYSYMTHSVLHINQKRQGGDTTYAYYAVPASPRDL